MRHKCAVLVVVTQLFKGLLLVQLSFYQSVKDSDLFCNHPSHGGGWVAVCPFPSLAKIHRDPVNVRGFLCPLALDVGSTV